MVVFDHRRMNAVAATAALSFLPAPSAAGFMQLADITTTDPLGYECIPAQYFDEDSVDVASVAFSLGGKVKLPRTCLKDPCAGAIEQAELASLTGTYRMSELFAQEWNHYYARYSDHCRNETTPFVEDTVANETTLPDPYTIAGFDDPQLLPDPVVSGVSVSSRLPNLDTGSPATAGTTVAKLGPINPFLGSGTSNGPSIVLVGSPGNSEPRETIIFTQVASNSAVAPVSEVSLPASGPMIALAFGSIGAVVGTRRRKRTAG